jgi:hypothetical protein
MDGNGLVQPVVVRALLRRNRLPLDLAVTVQVGQHHYRYQRNSNQ